jgi:hypothetical protein
MSGSMLMMIGALVVLGIVVVVVKAVVGAAGSGSKDFPYERTQALFTPAELAFLAVLEEAVGRRVRIMGKVRLADVVDVRTGLESGARQTARNRIQSKHLDFVACNPETFAVCFVVELDDKSHGRADRQERDQFLDQAMQAAGIPVFHFAVKRSYAVADIREVLKGA